MSATRRLQLAWVAIAAAILDVALTSFALGSGLGAEGNPIAAHGIRMLGVGPLVALDLLVRIGLVVALAWIAGAASHPRTRSAAIVVFSGVAAFWTLIVVSNAGAIALAAV